MGLILTAGPAVEPLVLDEVKAHLRVTEADENTLIDGLIRTARRHLEATLGRVFITQTWSWFLDSWPNSDIAHIPLPPLQSIVEIKTHDKNDVATTLDPQNYAVDTTHNPGRVFLLGTGLATAKLRALSGIEISFRAGYGDTAISVPEPLRQAQLLLIAHWYENRQPIALGSTAAPVPVMVDQLVSPYRERRL